MRQPSLLVSAPAAFAADINLALDKPATGSLACAGAEGPEKAVNGGVAGGNGDKWCSTASVEYLQVDLGAPASITGFTVEHAGAGGEAATYNTKAFAVQLSSDGSTWTTAVSVTDNTASTTTHPITAASARCAKLVVTTPTQTADPAARIYEFEVYGASSGTPAAASSRCSTASRSSASTPAVTRSATPARGRADVEPGHRVREEADRRGEGADR
ncbi:discoidin domain-containing protein [Lentzea roselyniae]|uniref:discoidin domain-containing protein n=1 Tax=Lentzea roselyniae TaxID=531940 RepID=UPI0031F9DC22